MKYFGILDKVVWSRYFAKAALKMHGEYERVDGGFIA